MCVLPNGLRAGLSTVVSWIGVVVSLLLLWILLPVIIVAIVADDGKMKEFRRFLYDMFFEIRRDAVDRLLKVERE